MHLAINNVCHIFLICVMLTGCASKSNFIDAGLGGPPDELIVLLDSPKRHVRTFSQGHRIDSKDADEAANEIIREWNMLSHSSTFWPDLTFFQMKGTRYIYKDCYVYQIYSPIRILPIAILIPMNEGIVIIVNMPEPYRDRDERFPGAPWDFDDLRAE